MPITNQKKDKPKDVYLVLYNSDPIAVCSSMKNANKCITRSNKSAYKIKKFDVDFWLKNRNKRDGMNMYSICLKYYGAVTDATILSAIYWSAETFIPDDRGFIEFRVWSRTKKDAMERARKKMKWLMTENKNAPDPWA